MAQRYITLGGAYKQILYEDSNEYPSPPAPAGKKLVAFETDGVVSFPGGITKLTQVVNLHYLHAADQDAIMSAPFPSAPKAW